jgi:hypothetical protein
MTMFVLMVAANPEGGPPRTRKDGTMPGSAAAATAPPGPIGRDQHVGVVPDATMSYSHLMVAISWPFEVRAGPDDAAFYEGWVEMSVRDHPGARFELRPGAPWQWVGGGGPTDATLVDVLAAIYHARLEHLKGADAVDVQQVHDAHQQALMLAFQQRDLKLAERLAQEQAEVAAPNLVDEQQLQRRLKHRHAQSVANLRLPRPVRRVCPPVYIPAGKRTSWGWASSQIERWIPSRQGKGWRKGKTGASGWDAVPADRQGQVEEAVKAVDAADPHTVEWAKAILALLDLAGSAARVGELRGRSKQTGTAGVQEARQLVQAAPRRTVVYRCTRDHISRIPFAADAEVPATWECRCGQPAVLLTTESASAANGS